MQKTTSIIQSFSLDNYTSSDEPLIVRPPAILRAFRVQIVLTNQLNTARPAGCYIANYSGANELSAILLSNLTISDTVTNVPPATDTTTSYGSCDRLILDRRGVGYMADTFYIWDAALAPGAATICFIWEGEID